MRHALIKKTPADDAPIAAPITEPCAVEWSGSDEAVAELELKLELEPMLELELILELELGLEPDGVEMEFDSDVEEVLGNEKDVDTEVEGSDIIGLGIDEEVDKVIDVAVPIPDPIENWLIASASEQQLPLCVSGSPAPISQHINPPFAAQRFEHCQTGGPARL